MSWAKESARAGLAGYNLRQAARAALLDPNFQQLEDPLDPELNPFEKQEDSKSWFVLGQQVRLEVVDDERAGDDQDQTEEDKEVQKLMEKGKMVKRKIRTAVRTLAAGHKMVAEGWKIFDEAVEDAGAGDLPQLLRSIKGMTTPQLPTLPPMDASVAHSPTPSPSPAKKEPGSDDPIMIRVEGKIKYSCPQCDKVITSKNGCDAYIHQMHSGKALMCSFCRFSTYNLDSLNRHAREFK